MDSQSNIRVAIVEDHEATLAGLASALNAESDIEVVAQATDAITGLELAKEKAPDIVLLDLHLPGSEGPRSTVKKFCELPGKVIVFSAENRRAFVQAILDLGVAGYLLKSESISNVIEAIKTVSNGGKVVKSQSIAMGKEKLTKAEQDVLTLLSRGMKYHEIGEERSASPATVRKQCELLLLKLGLDNREQLIAWAVENGYGKLDTE
ncbi:response regulator transcription factor [Candidatus Obscuribacterales bacterium]|nr:response regulator transcription factor [Candidatus Obscuribacterales bacterium]MBX3152442.1 response regulator transcription factor [Candidatus Obscuribacterales bacterium]